MKGEKENMGNSPHFLDNEINESFKFVKLENCKGINFEVYSDDYGQSYVLAWIDPRTREIKTWCCGTYNDYQNDMEDIAEHILEVRVVW